MNSVRTVRQSVSAVGMAALVLGSGTRAHAQPAGEFVPVTDAMLQAPAAEDWLTWRRTTGGWGYSPLDTLGIGR